MEKESARNQTLEQRHERRKQAVRPHRQGIKIMQLVPMPRSHDPIWCDKKPASKSFKTDKSHASGLGRAA
jgi:hypothetical protein